MPLSTSFNAPERVPVEVHHRRAGPASCGVHWCPKNASAVDDRPADHVERLRQVGQHLLRPARAEGRRGQGGRDGRAARACSWRTDVDRSWPRRSTPTGGARSPSASATPPRSRWPTSSPRSPPTGRYCEPLPVQRDPRPRRQAGDVPGQISRGAALPPGGQPDVARAATDAARCVTGYGAAEGQLRRVGDLPDGVRHAAAGRWPARAAPRTATGRRGSCGFTPQLAAAAFVADPDNPENVVGLRPRHDLEVHRRGDAEGRPEGSEEEEVHSAADSRMRALQPLRRRRPSRRRGAGLGRARHSACSSSVGLVLGLDHRPEQARGALGAAPGTATRSAPRGCAGRPRTPDRWPGPDPSCA